MTRRPRHRDAFGLIGWLFADLTLVLAMLFLASSTVARPLPTPSPTPVPTASPSSPSPSAVQSGAPSPTPTPSPSCKATVLLRENRVRVSGSKGRVDYKAVKKAFARFEDRHVGLLLTFVHGRSDSEGIKWAAAVNKYLRRSFPDAVTKRTIDKDYYNNLGGIGTVTFVAFLMSQECP